MTLVFFRAKSAIARQFQPKARKVNGISPFGMRVAIFASSRSVRDIVQREKMVKRILLILALTTLAMGARAVTFMSLSNPVFDESVEFIPLIVTGYELPEEASVPLAFMLDGYRPEDEIFTTPDI